MSRLRILAASLLVFLAASAPVAAQSSLLMQLRSASASDRFVVDSAGGFFALGTFGKGSIPVSGSNTRLMWYPGKAALRAGYANWTDTNTGDYSAAFGYLSHASGDYAFAAGSAQASANSSVALGFAATAAGVGAVAIGGNTSATGSYSVAIGSYASDAGFSGSVVFGDNSGGTDTVKATANNQFVARAAGGYRLYSNAAKTAGVTVAAGASSWGIVSDRNRKQDFAAVDGESLLARLRQVPVTTWRYRAEEDRSVRHIGPMAQDWDAAFGFAHDSTTINMSDLDGVSLAAIEALEERTRQQAARIQALEADSAALREVREEVAQLRALLKSRTAAPGPGESPTP